METPPSQHDLQGNFNPAPLIEAGLDEAGRGCLAGPVVAAAVILPTSVNIPRLADSKKLSPRQRAFLAPIIKKQCVAWSIGCVWPARIDEINILQATLEAMSIAAAHIGTPPQKLLLDGNQIIPTEILNKNWQKRHSTPSPRQLAIVKGDAKIPAISAASIIAKTFRDNLMTIFARHFPAYGFERHKGYGTQDHLRAIARYGPTRIHRMSFRGVRPENPDNWHILQLSG